MHPRRLGLLAAAGIVHDIGYSPLVVDTGFHPIDGARHLRRLGFHEDLVGLVAHHSCAHVEAGLRDLGPTIHNEFPRDHDLPHDELTFCDLTTGPKGQLLTVDERLADIKERYGPDDLVYQFITMAEDELVSSVRRAEASLAGQVLLVGS